MSSEEFMKIAKQLVEDYEFKNDELMINNVGEPKAYIVWFAYELGHMKALLSTQLPNHMYYEVTYNSNKNEIYFDAYHKLENISYNIHEVNINE